MQLDLAPSEARVPLRGTMNASIQCRKQGWEGKGGRRGGVSSQTPASGGNEVGARAGMIMDVDVSSSGDGDELGEEMSELRRRYRVFCLNLAQINDADARQRMMEVWNEVFLDVSFLDELQAEFDRKEAEEHLEFFDSHCVTRRFV